MDVPADGIQYNKAPRIVATFAKAMQPQKKINLIECPRDAMQGWKHFYTHPKKDRLH